MAGNYCRVYVHLVWKTWDKLPLLQPDVVSIAYKVILSKAQDNSCPVLAIGGVEDHVHVVIRLHSTAQISKVVREMKSGSSHEINVARPGKFFEWQGSYGALSVSESALQTVIRYVENQADHHKRNYLKNELETIDLDEDGPEG